MTDSNIAGIAEADFGKAGVSFDNDRPILVDSSDFLFYAALAMLPIDGTVAGPYMPFWTPLSPWLFMAYAVANWRLLPQVWHRFRAFFLFPVLLIALSAVDWCLVAFHRLPALVSLAGVAGALACLCALDMALRIKRLSWRRMLDLLILVYWFAFAVGVVQRLSIMFDWTSVKNFFIHLMSRQYISSTSHWGGGRPQFLFAEPSYIGMHLFGVLLPLIWLVRGRDHKRANQLRVLIMVFAAGSVLMGAGVRIILDSIVALVFVIIESADWKSWRGRLLALAELVAAVGAGTGSMLLNHRLSSIAELGFDGDGSFYARLWQSMGPLVGAAKHPLRPGPNTRSSRTSRRPRASTARGTTARRRACTCWWTRRWACSRTSPTRTVPGSVAATRTGTAGSAAICPKEPGSRTWPRRTSTRSSGRSTTPR